MPKIYKIHFTLSYFKKVVKNSTSWTEVSGKLKLSFGGESVRKLRDFAINNNIDYYHFRRRGYNKGTRRQKLENYLNNTVKITSSHLKNRLINDGVKEYKCERCKLTEWMGEPIPLDLHHSDGDHSNNNLTNLQVLCVNCHRQIDKYASIKNTGENILSDAELIPIIKQSRSILEVLKRFGRRGGNNYPRIRRIMKENNLEFLDRFMRKEDLKLLVNKESIPNIAKKLKVCSQTVRDWCYKYKIEIPDYRSLIKVPSRIEN
jgi:5-methylcytosine-specific restriction endonuclease McrA